MLYPLRKNGSLTLLLMGCVLAFGADLAHAARITAIAGISQGQAVTGELFVETKVAGATDGADYRVRYEVKGPDGFVMTAERAPYVLRRDRAGWDTRNNAPGAYQVTAYLIRNGRVVDFRSIDFTIGSDLKVSRIIGINRDITLTRATSVEAKIRGGTPSKVVFEVKGPTSLTYTDRQRPYFLLGDGAKWDVKDVPAGNYTISVTAYNGDKPAHTRTLPFKVEKDIRIRRVIGINNDMVLTAPVRVEAEVVGGVPSKVEFRVTGPRQIFDVEQRPPYVLFGDDGVWDVTEYPAGQYTLRGARVLRRGADAHPPAHLPDRGAQARAGTHAHAQSQPQPRAGHGHHPDAAQQELPGHEPRRTQLLHPRVGVRGRDEAVPSLAAHPPRQQQPLGLRREPAAGPQRLAPAP